MALFEFSDQPLDTAALQQSLANPACGGYASFEGWVRDVNEGRAVEHLEYEAFIALGVKEGERIVRDAMQRFGVREARCVHRIGDLKLGELAVWVGVASAHRGEAFAACRYIIDEVKHRVPIWKKEHYVDGDSGWVNCERCAAPTQHAHDHDHHHDAIPRHAHTHEHAKPAAAGTASDYSRQTVLPEVGDAGQARLRAARVLVVGAGGLGVPVLGYLAGAGIGTLGVVDADTLDPSNLHRQTLYALEDVGRPKALLAATHLRKLNPEVDVRPYVERATHENLPALAAGYDVLVDCSDNFSTRFLVNDVAVSLGLRAVVASVYQYEGQIQVLTPGSACLRCVWPEATRDGLVGNCAEAGVIGPVPGVLGSLQALEVLKLLLAMDSPTHNAVVLVDLRSLETRRLKAPRATDCPEHCRPGPAPTAGTVTEVRSLAEAATLGLTIIDIRNSDETATQPLTVAHRHIPLAQLLETPSPLAREGRYLLVCARGMRSRAAAETLHERGFRAIWSLAGGLAGQAH
jgi:adenylyltransferase/sulfurtransferase